VTFDRQDDYEEIRNQLYREQLNYDEKTKYLENRLAEKSAEAEVTSLVCSC